MWLLGLDFKVTSLPETSLLGLLWFLHHYMPKACFAQSLACSWWGWHKILEKPSSELCEWTKPDCSELVPCRKPHPSQFLLPFALSECITTRNTSGLQWFSLSPFFLPQIWVWFSSLHWLGSFISGHTGGILPLLLLSTERNFISTHPRLPKKCLLHREGLCIMKQRRGATSTGSESILERTLQCHCPEQGPGSRFCLPLLPKMCIFL